MKQLFRRSLTTVALIALYAIPAAYHRQERTRDVEARISATLKALEVQSSAKNKRASYWVVLSPSASGWHGRLRSGGPGFASSSLGLHPRAIEFARLLLKRATPYLIKRGFLFDLVFLTVIPTKPRDGKHPAVVLVLYSHEFGLTVATVDDDPLRPKKPFGTKITRVYPERTSAMVEALRMLRRRPEMQGEFVVRNRRAKGGETVTVSWGSGGKTEIFRKTLGGKREPPSPGRLRVNAFTLAATAIERLYNHPRPAVDVGDLKCRIERDGKLWRADITAPDGEGTVFLTSDGKFYFVAPTIY